MVVYSRARDLEGGRMKSSGAKSNATPLAERRSGRPERGGEKMGGDEPRREREGKEKS